MKTPNEIYNKSNKAYRSMLVPLEYPNHDYTLKVSQCGSIRNKDFRVYLGVPFGGNNVGMRQIDENVLEVNFMDYSLGFLTLKVQE